MKPNYTAALVIGGVAGLVMALALFTFFAAYGAVPSLTVELDGTDVVPTFSAAASATWMIVILAGIVGGALIATITRVVARVIEPEGKSVSLGVIASVGALIAPTVAMVVFPLGITVMGSVREGSAVIGVADFVVLAAVAGLLAGGSVAWLSYILARPSVPADDPELLAA
ncbi:MAG: hypothetical protein DWP92_00365 [Armatimonadetes bacterium]|nr:MAG: hypothetical protein DWP92_00365 [Armatimonadota bacterium]